MKTKCWMFALVLLFVLGCNQPQPKLTPIKNTATSMCIVFYGFGGDVFSGGLDKLKALPVQTFYFEYKDWEQAIPFLNVATGPIYIVGHSAGAAVATRLAAKTPKQINTLFLIDCSPNNPLDDLWDVQPIPENVERVIYWVTGKPNNVTPGPDGWNHRTTFHKLPAGKHDHLSIDTGASEQILAMWGK